MPYSSSFSERKWELIEPLLPKKKKTRPPKWSKRAILDGIFYQLKNGCNWCDLPKDLPPYSTVFWHYKHWRADGVIEQIMDILHGHLREQIKKRQWTRLIIIDSQAVKNTYNAQVESKEFCHYKSTHGIKRHLAVNRLGFSFFSHCTSANVTDDAELIEMLSAHIEYFKRKPVNLPKITILIDHGYHPDKIISAVQEHYPAILQKVCF